MFDSSFISNPKLVIPNIKQLNKLTASLNIPLIVDATLTASVGILAKYNIEEIINLYKFLHSNPELSWQEDKTASYLADILEADGYKVTRGVGKKGVVAILENGKGPTLMIRADMDALPIEEKTNLEYASKVRQINRFGKEAVSYTHLTLPTKA